MSQPIIAITMGDPAGIGAEIALKALGDPALRASCRLCCWATPPSGSGRPGC